MIDAINAMGSVLFDPYLLFLIFATTILGVVIGVLPGEIGENGAGLGKLVIGKVDNAQVEFGLGESAKGEEEGEENNRVPARLGGTSACALGQGEGK